MPSTRFPLHPTYGSGTDNKWRLSRWPPWQPSWIWFWWKYPKCEKLLTDIRIMRDGPWSTDHSISWQLKSFKMTAVVAIVDIVTKWFSNSESPCHPNASQCGGHLWCRNGTNLASLNLHVSPMPSAKFQLNPTYRSEADVVSRFSWWPSWILEQNKFSNSKPPSHPNASHQV